MRRLKVPPSRNGFKGVPGKNLRRIAGLSLLGFKARAAQASATCARLMISTDSVEIQEEARRHGVEVPFTRPAELASDIATSASVVAHTIAWLEENERARYDAIMLLEPSSPFATPAHFDAAVDLFSARAADLVVGMRHAEPPTTFIGPRTPDASIAPIVHKMNQAAGLRRQDQAEEWTMNGSLYLFRWSAFKASGKIYGAPERCFGLLMDRWHSIEIEAPEDLAFAEFAVAQGYVDTTPWALSR
jgi:N-acylneuraminate cytidylyltransferase/CMP-N,N'-diacetyllegionaminic acid synthase